MVLRDLMHPRMLTGLRDFYPHVCTIQVDNGTRDTHGQIIPDWQDLVGHVAIPCRRAAGSGNVVRTEKQKYSVKTPSIALQGHYPSITTKMRAVVNGTEFYNIIQPRHDAQGASTTLDVELVS